MTKVLAKGRWQQNKFSLPARNDLLHFHNTALCIAHRLSYPIRD